MGWDEEGGWFTGWRQCYLSRSGSEGRYAKVHPDYWDEVRGVFTRHRVSKDESEHVMQHLIRHGPLWPDQLIAAIERAITAVRPTVPVPPPVVSQSAHAQREWVRARLVSELGLELELDSECYAVLVLAAERLVEDAKRRGRSIEQYSDESVQRILSDAMDEFLMMRKQDHSHE